MDPGTGADAAALQRSYEVTQPLDATTAQALLREAKRIMDRLEIVFFLRQGTCLGAIRDNGFIPWDDDLDLGSVIGLHGFAERSVDRVASAFRDNGYFVKLDRNDHYISLAMMKSYIRMDWTCYRIIEDSIFHFPEVRIPVRLLTHLKEIDFIGEKFLVPNPPTEYLRFKYGPDWMTPKKTGYEKDVLDNIPEGPLPGRGGRFQGLVGRLFPRWHTLKLRVLGEAGTPIPCAEVVIAGVGRSRTNGRGEASFYLPGDDWYALVVTFGGHEEVLYQEMLTRGSTLVYRRDPSATSSRLLALSPE